MSVASLPGADHADHTEAYSLDCPLCARETEAQRSLIEHKRELPPSAFRRWITWELGPRDIAHWDLFGLMDVLSEDDVDTLLRKGSGR